jgi:hypothetical protein
MGEAKTNRTSDPLEGTSHRISSDAKGVSATADVEAQQYLVDGKAVTREEYMEALPKAGYVPERMPANHYPAINTK